MKRTTTPIVLTLGALLLPGVLLGQDKTPPVKEEEKTKPEKKPVKPPKKAAAKEAAPKGVSHFPLTVGRRWAYKVSYRIKPIIKEGDDPPAAGGDEVGNHAVVVYVAAPQKINERRVATLEWKLDEALAQRCYYVLEKGTVHCVRRLQGSGQQVKSWSFSPTQPVMPAALKVGLKWSWAGKNGPDKGKQTWEVLRREDVETPAGKFKAFVIQTQYTGEDGSSGKQTRWVAAGIGIVKEVSTTRTKRQVHTTEGYLRSFEKP